MRNVPKVKQVINAPGLAKMEKIIKAGIKRIARAVENKVLIKIRYDSDADGVLAALILKKCIEKYAEKHGVQLNLRKQQSNGAIYSEQNFEEDNLTLANGTLLIFLDHGANEQSVEALCKIAKKTEIIIIDHHPPAEKNCSHLFISPFAVNCNDPASYNTALICFELGRRMAPELEKEIYQLCLYSMQADTSLFRSKEFYPEAVVVDYLVKKSKEPYSLEFYDKILKDKHLVKELCREEQNIIEEKLKKALRKAKIYTGKYTIVTCDVSGVIRNNRYPPIGKLHNSIQFYFDEKSPTASLIYDKQRLSFRASHSAAAMGFSANKIINELKNEYEKYGFSGGGHDVAASTRFPQEYAKEIVAKAIEMVIKNAGNEQNNSTKF